MTKLVFVHGWGLGPGLWDGLIKELADYPCECLDLGYFGSQKTAVGEDAVYITHSMGCAWLLDHFLPRKGLVVINGFTRFCADPSWPEGVPARVLKLMMRQFENDPQAVWLEFMKNCNHPQAVYDRAANELKLKEGLGYLLACDVRKSYSALPCKKLVLASMEDRIVAKKLTEVSFGQDVIWYKGAHHLLPLFEAESLGGHIRDFMDHL